MLERIARLFLSPASTPEEAIARRVRDVILEDPAVPDLFYNLTCDLFDSTYRHRSVETEDQRILISGDALLRTIFVAISERENGRMEHRGTLHLDRNGDHFRLTAPSHGDPEKNLERFRVLFLDFMRQDFAARHQSEEACAPEAM